MEQRPWIRDFAPVVAAFGLCPLVALAGGADPADAIARGREVADAERALGVFVEPGLHAWAAARDPLLAVAEAAYLVLHVPALIGALAWAYLARPGAFPRLRTAFLATQTLVAAGWLLLPTAPPRLVDGLLPGQAVRGPAPDGLTSLVQSPYAAMPSGHVAFALFVGGTIVVLGRGLPTRVAGALYPVLVIAVTVATANHFWLDAAGAIAVVGLATVVALAVHRAPRRAPAYAPGSG